MMTREQLEADVEDDGSVPSFQDVQTDYARLEAIGHRVCHDGNYIFIIGDYQDRFIEIRVSVETMEKAGWVRDPNRPLGCGLEDL